MVDEKKVVLLFYKSRSTTWVNICNYFMPRNLPRFLFSDPKNSKSNGPFIVHTMEPRIIVRVAKVPNHDPGPMTHNGKYILFFLEEYKMTKKLRHTTDAMFKWIDSQVKAGEIEIPSSN